MGRCRSIPLCGSYSALRGQVVGIIAHNLGRINRPLWMPPGPLVVDYYPFYHGPCLKITAKTTIDAGADLS